MKLSSCIVPWHLFVAMLLLPTSSGAADGDESISRLQGERNRRRTHRKLLWWNEGQESCPSDLEACQASHRPGSLNYDGLLGYLDKLNPPSDGSIANFRAIIQSAAGFSEAFSDQPEADISIIEGAEADSLVEQTTLMSETIQEQQNTLHALVAKENEGDIQEHAIDAIVNIMAVISDHIADVALVFPLVGSIADFFITIKNFFVNLALPFLQGETFVFFASVAAAVAAIAVVVAGAITGLVLGIIAIVRHSTQNGNNNNNNNNKNKNKNKSKKNLRENEYDRLLLDDEWDSMECVSELFSCRVEDFIAENSAPMLELALFSDAGMVTDEQRHGSHHHG